MREDIVNMIGSKKKLTHILIATFSIDFVFIETVLLRQLRKCGQPTLTILADADEVAATFAAQGPWVGRLGRRYRVVPVRMNPGFRFHPKAILLSGPEDAELLIGSGNLTFGGMRQNEEVWARFRAGDGDGAAIAGFRKFFSSTLLRTTQPRPARTELAEAYGIDSHIWAQSLPEPSGLLVRPSDMHLLDQMAREVGDMPVQRIFVISPYFDDEGEALKQISLRWPEASLEVFIQEGKSQLIESAWRVIREPKRLRHMASSRQGEDRPFIHAKAYAFVGEDEAVAIVGSANCSRAALLLTNDTGNAEVMATLRMPVDDVESSLLDGIEMIDAPPTLRQEPDSKPDPPQPRVATIHSVQLEHGWLLIHYALGAGASIRDLSIDLVEVGLDGTDDNGSTLKLRWQGQAMRVQIGYEVGEDNLWTPEHWVDQEFLLSATSRQRQLAQHLGDNIAPGQWSFQGWTEVMRLLGDHLKHVPVAQTQQSRQQAAKEVPSEIDSQAFFSGSYKLPSRRTAQATRAEATRLAGLRGLLLEYFGVDYDGHEGEDDSAESDDEDEVDRPTDIRKRKKTRKKKKARKRDSTQAEQRRGQKIAKQVIDFCTSPDYAEHRPPAMLSADLSIAAVMLISGHAESWLPDELFIELTYLLWTHLFFDDGTDPKGTHAPMGALARRFENTPDQKGLVAGVVSPRLAAALALWCFSCPPGMSGPETARFNLATRLSVARTPWLWALNDLKAVEEELFAIADRTGWLGDAATQQWEAVLKSWHRMFEEGVALGKFEASLLSQPLEELRNAIPRGVIEAKTLLWQGPKVGFSILTQDANRAKENMNAVPVLSLRRDNRDLNVQPFFLLPFTELLTIAGKNDATLRPSEIESLKCFEARLGGSPHGV